MLFLPVTRTDEEHVARVVRAFDTSDIPKKVYLYLDAPNTEIWIDMFQKRGWRVSYTQRSNDAPPNDRQDRWYGHYLMRKETQSLIAHLKTDYVLLSEDDTIVPKHIWKDLKKVYELAQHSNHFKKSTAITGVQRSRHDGHYIGVMHKDADNGCYDPMDLHLNDGIQYADSCGLYALFTTLSDFATVDIEWSEYEPIDRIITRQFDTLLCDTNVWCAHRLDNGTEIM